MDERGLREFKRGKDLWAPIFLGAGTGLEKVLKDVVPILSSEVAKESGNERTSKLELIAMENNGMGE